MTENTSQAFENDKNFQSIDFILEELIKSSPKSVEDYINKIRLNNPSITNDNQEEIARKVINSKALWSGTLGFITGLGGLSTLVVTIPLDFVKALKIQAFIIHCIAHVYGYTTKTTDLKRDILLIISHNSFEQIEESINSEVAHLKKQQIDTDIKASVTGTWVKAGVKAGVKTTCQTGAKTVGKVGSQMAIKFGERAIRDYTLRKTPRIFRELIWRISGKKIAERFLQKSISRVVPILGGFIGAGLDWGTTRSVGLVALDYYKNDGPYFIELVFDSIISDYNATNEKKDL